MNDRNDESVTEKMASKMIAKAIDGTREKASAMLARTLDYIAVGTAARYLNASRRSLFRWAAGGLCLVPTKKISEVFALCERVEGVRKYWTDFLAAWRDDISNADVESLFYHPELLAIIRDKNDAPSERVRRCTRKIFWGLANLELPDGKSVKEIEAAELVEEEAAKKAGEEEMKEIIAEIKSGKSEA